MCALIGECGHDGELAHCARMRDIAVARLSPRLRGAISRPLRGCAARLVASVRSDGELGGPADIRWWPAKYVFFGTAIDFLPKTHIKVC